MHVSTSIFERPWHSSSPTVADRKVVVDFRVPPKKMYSNYRINFLDTVADT